MKDLMDSDINSDASIRILVTGDYALTRAGLAAILSRMPGLCVVGEAQDAEESVARCHQLQPHIVLIETGLFPATGIAVARLLDREVPDIDVILYSLSDAGEDICQAFQWGVKAYLRRDTTLDNLLQTIRAVHAGENCVPPGVAARLMETAPSRAFTPPELDVLRALVRGKSDREIGAAFCLAEGAVKAHVSSILLKLNVRDRTQAVVMALMRGVVCVP